MEIKRWYEFRVPTTNAEKVLKDPAKPAIIEATTIPPSAPGLPDE